MTGIENLINLRELSCYNNQLTTLPICLLNFGQLACIDYLANEIEHISPALLRYIYQINDRQQINLQVYDDKQNVHNSNITNSIKNTIMMLLETVKPIKYDTLMITI